MTSRERMLVAASGGEVDRRPVLAWPHPDTDADVLCFPIESSREVIETAEDKLALVEVVNPFGLSVQRDISLNNLLRDTPELGDRVLTGLAREVSGHIREALDNGADGVLYRLHGARGLYCTPMQYGGHYLERDREILNEANKARFNVIFVVGDEDVYIDFVSDLPAHAFGWDVEDSMVTLKQVRAMRKGPLMSTDPESDILLEPGTEHISTVLESVLRTEDANV